MQTIDVPNGIAACQVGAEDLVKNHAEGERE